jgi:peptide/nickel transport system ATP-binding protein
MRKIRGNRISMIFQEPMTSLNPVLTVGAQIAESLHIHQGLGHREARDRAIDMLSLVRIADPKRRAGEYPHQLSGGMRQRVMIAIALACNPQVLVADEPTTALDVTIQGQILFEMQKLCRESGAGLMWITHDLSVIAGLADQVCVMYAGRIVESGPVDDILSRPMHPYTRGLLDSVPARNVPGRPLAQIPGMTPSLLRLGAACAFRERCPRSAEPCASAPATRASAPGRTLRCFNPIA